MRFDYSPHVSGATLTRFDGVAVKDLKQPAAPWEVLSNQFEESTGDVGFHVFTIGWVKPLNSSGKVLFLPWPSPVLILYVLYVFIESACFERLIVCFRVAIKDVFVG